MKWFVSSKISLLLIGFCAVLLVGAGSAEADFIFGTPTNLGPTINTGSGESRPGISADGLELYVSSNRPGGLGTYDIYVARRATTDDDWGPLENLGPTLNSSTRDSEPDISADGLTLYFNSEQPGGYGKADLWVARRPTKNDAWDSIVNLGPTVNSSVGDFGPSISADGLELFFTSGRPGGYGDSDLWVTTRETTQDDWGEPLNLGQMINSSSVEQSPSISADGLTLFFDSGPDRGGSGNFDLWVTIRATKSEPWGEPVNLGPAVNSSAHDCAPSISADGSTLFFWSSRSPRYGASDLCQALILPIVDFNGDGIVDSADMCIMVDNWGTDEPLCDIGPMPWGDSVVDVQDLIVLAEHLFEEFGGKDDDFGEIVIERRILAGSDDAEEALNAGYTNWNYSSDLEIVDDHIDNGGNQLIGMTFRDIVIAPGEVINNAYIEFVCDETKNGTDDAYLLIWGHLTPNPDGFIAPYVISDRPKTETKVPWEPDPWNAIFQRIQTVDIAPIIQELIDQEGWAAGNAVEIIIGADPSKPAFTGVRCAVSYDGSPSNAPLLHIEIAAP